MAKAKYDSTTPKPKRKDGSGTIYQRGNIYWVKVYIDGKPHYESSGSEKYEDAKKLRDKLIGQRHRGEISGGHPDRVTVGELLTDLLEYAKTGIRPLYRVHLETSCGQKPPAVLRHTEGAEGHDRDSQGVPPQASLGRSDGSDGES